MLESGSNLHVTSVRRYDTIAVGLLMKNKKKDESQIAMFYFTWRARTLRYYSVVIHSFDWKSAVEHDGCV